MTLVGAGKCSTLICFDSLGRARRITEDGEVVDVTPAPPLVDLVDDTKPFTMGAWDGKPGHATNEEARRCVWGLFVSSVLGK